MKLFIASDIHGSAYYTELLLERFRTEKSDKILLLGDILYHGPRNDLPKEYNPKAVIAMLNDVSDRIIAVRGNCEAEVDSMVLDFNVASDYATVFLDGVGICATHGHREEPKMAGLDVLLCGHTHVPTLDKREGFVYINPGSVSIPKEASPHSYMTLEDGHFRWCDLNTGECYMEYAF